MGNRKKREIIIQGTLADVFDDDTRIKRGRLSPELIQEICDLLRISVFYETALASVNVSEELMRQWMRTGRRFQIMLDAKQVNQSRITKHQRLCVALYQQVRTAIAVAEVRDTQRLEAHINLGSETALRFKMERRYPKNWGSSKDHEIHISTPNEIDAAIDAPSLVGGSDTNKPVAGIIDYSSFIETADELKDDDVIETEAKIVE